MDDSYDGRPVVNVCAVCERETLPRLCKSAFHPGASDVPVIVVEPQSTCPHCMGWTNQSPFNGQ